MTVSFIADIKKEMLVAFDCGDEALNTYLKAYALQNDRKNISKTFVFTEGDKIIGYYSLSNAQIGFESVNDELKKGLPRYPIPAIRLARLAVSLDEQDRGFGSKLLKDAFLRILRISQQTGICFIIVDAKEDARSFYERFGFIELDSCKSTYILPVSVVRKASEQPSI